MLNLQAYFYNGNIYYIIENVEQIWMLFGIQALAVDELQVFFTKDKHVELYAAWHVGHVERLNPNIPVLFKSTHPITRILYVVETAEDVEEFDSKLPLYLNHVKEYGLIPGLRPFSHEVYFIYRIASVPYSWVDYYFGWIYHLIYY